MIKRNLSRFFLCPKFERRDTLKDNLTELQKIKSEIETKENEKEKCEKKLVQLQNQAKYDAYKPKEAHKTKKIGIA